MSDDLSQVLEQVRKVANETVPQGGSTSFSSDCGQGVTLEKILIGIFWSNPFFSNHGHGDAPLTAVRGWLLWLTPLLEDRVRHTNRPLNPPKGIFPCLWIANNRNGCGSDN